MAVGLRGRIERLEAQAGGECPRCSGVIGVFMGGELQSASRHGEPMSADEWAGGLRARRALPSVRRLSGQDKRRRGGVGRWGA